VVRWKSIAVGIATILAGTAAALPFRKSKDPASSDRSPASQSAGESGGFDVTLQLSSASEAASHQESSFGAEPSAFEDVSTQARASLEGFEPPPGLARAYESLAIGDQPSAREQSDSEADRPSERLHLVADGDTLEALAERYLGSREHWQVIFRANTEVLRSPELLPIGTELLIPASGQLAAPDGLVPVPQQVLRLPQ
jgi:nucleoid-associated protein YgaU